MKMIPIEEVKSEDEARELAIAWQNWQSEQALSIGELADWNDYFKKLGEWYELTEEFEENGII